ncbi:hypothetical protein [Acinetobacter baumannii]|uniref:hypothetical protein n=1 Tax=Acinetobacter baumannii TaxID=470 RepID=UPI002D77C217|nr:hypothetical protein [Acinetobacter baumannii]HDQ4282013.1 hypothetical protein [Acinetobacter baumannii]
MNYIAKINSEQAGSIGRIGGNIPIILTEKKDELKDYVFYMTFQNHENNREYLSIFVHKLFDERIDNNIYPNIAVKIFIHKYSNESNITDYTAKELNTKFIAGYDEVEDDEFNLITYSKTPNLIQEENYYFENLNKDNFEFFIQIDEDFYTDNTLKGTYIFAYGALYIFKQKETGKIVAGFWQH